MIISLLSQSQFGKKILDAQTTFNLQLTRIVMEILSNIHLHSPINAF